jgi:serine/threonine protein kinase
LSVSIGDKLLGKGEFGLVYKGLAHTLPAVLKGPTTVAIKTLINCSDVDHQQMFAEEFRVMAKMGRHINIVNLLGVVMQGEPQFIMLK